MSELYLPPTYAKLPPSSPFYVESIDNPKLHAKREQSRRNCLARWAKPGAHDFVNTSQAKDVDVFDLKGRFVASFPSSRKACAGMGFENKMSAERNIRACRRGEKKQYKGYMFKPHKEGRTRTMPYRRKPHGSGYHYQRNRNADTYKTKQIAWIDDNGLIQARWDSIKECADALGINRATIWIAMKQDRPLRNGIRLVFPDPKPNRETHEIVS